MHVKLKTRKTVRIAISLMILIACQIGCIGILAAPSKKSDWEQVKEPKLRLLKVRISSQKFVSTFSHAQDKLSKVDGVLHVHVILNKPYRISIKYDSNRVTKKKLIKVVQKTTKLHSELIVISDAPAKRDWKIIKIWKGDNLSITREQIEMKYGENYTK